MKEYIFGKVRVQILSDDIIRLECARKGKFCDKNTFFIPDRFSLGEPLAKPTVYGSSIVFGGYVINIASESGLSGITVTKDGTNVYRYKKIANNGELPALDKTPEIFALADNPRIIVPEGGYTYRGKLKNSGFVFEENVNDIYLLLCGGNAKKLRRLYVSLTGKSELVRLSALGAWNSKWFEYSETSAKALIEDYKKYDIPLDVMVIDTDWRAASDRGIGYDINKNLFPSMSRFFNFAHGRGVEIMFNDHPEPVEGAANIVHPAEVRFREKKLQSLLKLGLDIWWYDRNWHTALISPVQGVKSETFGMYLFEEITKHYFQTVANSTEIYRRPVIMGNVNNVANGAYMGVNDSASHKFSVQWTGDIASEESVIAQEIENMLRCSDNALPYVNADCGGHTGNPDKQTFIRWMQFGTLSPVFRPHCTKDVKRYREPWLYDEETLEIVREYIKLRYRLLPLIYKSAFESYNSGEPIFKALGWEYPQDKRALKCKNEYMLGNDILIAPICGDSIDGNKEIYLPAGKWLDVFDGKTYSGGKTISKQYSLKSMPLFIRLGALLPLAYAANNTKNQCWDRLVFDFYPDKNSSDGGYIYEDDTETTAYKLGQYRKSAYSAVFDSQANAFKIVFSPSEGSFKGEKAFLNRQLTLKYHLLSGVSAVKKITVNGADANFEKSAKDAAAFPLNTSNASADGGCITIGFNSEISKRYEIAIYLN